MTTRRTRIEHRDFICKSDEHHRFRVSVRLQTADDGQTIEHSADFRPVQRSSASTRYSAHIDRRSRLPLCPECGSIAEESTTYDPSLATVPAAERMQVWLSPDGRRVSIPGKRDAIMPSRYVASGYRLIEAHSMRDLDRIEAIRAEQTGNEVFSEMQFDRERRQLHEESEVDPDDMTSVI